MKTLEIELGENKYSISGPDPNVYTTADHFILREAVGSKWRYLCHIFSPRKLRRRGHIYGTAASDLTADQMRDIETILKRLPWQTLKLLID